jgi:PBP1b-binding outer membrane lipoprotein LpoB
MRSRVISLLLFAALITGCASDPGPKPEEERQAAYSAVRSADNAGAMDVESGMMNTAREKLERAQVLMEAQRYPEAKRMLDQAALDARLAESRTRTQQVRNELGDLQASIDSLRSNLENQQ